MNIGPKLTCSHVIKATERSLNNLIDSQNIALKCSELKKLLEELRRGDISQADYDARKREVKATMPYITPFTAEFKDGHRTKANAVRPSGLCFIDYDHVDPTVYWAKVKDRIDELGIVMAHVTPSGEGFRAIYVLPKGMNFVQAQAWFGEQIGEMDFDKSCKDPSKASILVCRDYIYYIDMDGLLMERTVDWDVINGQEVVETSYHGVSVNKKPKTPESDVSTSIPEPKTPHCDVSTATALIPEVVALEAVMGGAPEVGRRNNFIYEMIHCLRHLRNDAEWVFSVIPRYGLSEDEVWQTVCSVFSNHELPEEMPLKMRLAIERVNSSKDTAPQPFEVYPEMPEVLPPMIAHLVSHAPEHLHDVIAQGVFPALASHTCSVQFIALDGSKYDRAALFNICVAPQSIGKGSQDQPIAAIMKNIEERDAVSRRLQDEWRSKRRKNLAFDESAEKPDCVIQTIAEDITPACFNDMRRQAGENFLYLNCTELDDLKHFGNFGRMMRKAFDCSTWGQDRISAEAVTYRGPLYFCFNASCTSEKFYEFFKTDDFTNGTLGRTTLTTVIGNEPDGKRPQFKRYDDEYYHTLKPYIDHLDAAHGIVDCPEAIRLCAQLDAECYELYQQTGDWEYHELSKRAVVIGYRKAMILYLANGMQWDATFDDFVRWTVKYDLYCKMLFMSKQMKKNNKKAVVAKRTRGRENMLQLLPDTFTYEQVVSVRESEGMSTKKKTCDDQIRGWIDRGHITETGPKMRSKDIFKQMYMKTDAYLSRNLS